MKNWYISTECILVFCDDKKKEVAILHTHVCIHGKYCPDFPPESAALRGEIGKDENEIVHLDAYPSLNIDKVDWDILKTFIYYSGHNKVKTAGR